MAEGKSNLSTYVILLALSIPFTFGATLAYLKKQAKLEWERIDMRTEAFKLADHNKNGILEDNELIYLGKGLNFFNSSNPITLRELEKEVMKASKEDYLRFIAKEEE
ncbi:MAG: hypothetical protein AABW58_04905 [Nanoarchaeota archaeon]